MRQLLLSTLLLLPALSFAQTYVVGDPSKAIGMVAIERMEGSNVTKSWHFYFPALPHKLEFSKCEIEFTPDLSCSGLLEVYTAPARGTEAPKYDIYGIFRQQYFERVMADKSDLTFPSKRTRHYFVQVGSDPRSKQSAQITAAGEKEALLSLADEIFKSEVAPNISIVILKERIKHEKNDH